MKKAMALIFALAMCLSLCACGVDEAYSALLESLEAGDYAGVKAELTALSPDFAAEQEKLETFLAYEALVNALEAENYEAALADVQGRIPVPEEPVYEEIEITMDNWSEYFEIHEFEQVSYNDFQEIEYSYLGYALYLKDEYLESLKSNGADVSFKLEQSLEYRECDKETDQLVEGGKVLSDYETYGLEPVRECVVEARDGRHMENTETSISSANGEVCAAAYSAIGAYLGINDIQYSEITTDIVVADVTGTLLLAE